MLKNSKDFFKSYLLLFLNEIAVSTQYMSSPPVLSYLVVRPRHMRIDELMKNEEKPQQPAFSELSHKHDYLVANLDYMCSKSYYIRYNAISEKYPFPNCPTNKALNTRQVERYQHLRKANDFFSCCYVSTSNNFACLGPLTKVMFLYT